MKLEWFSHLSNPKDKESFKKSLLGSKIVLDRLKEICYNKINSGEKASVMDYDNPSWAYRQAHLNGYLQAYREISELCKVSDQGTK